LRASTTKLFTTAVIMQLRGEGRLDLDDTLGTHVESALVQGLNVWRGSDVSARITVRDLLAHTSGIANYFEQKRPDGGTLYQDVIEGTDRAWTFEEALDMARSMAPKFAPSSPGRAFYSDTNYQLLGAIIERLTDSSYEEQLRVRILAPLGLKRTWLFTQATLQRFDEVAPMLLGGEPLRIPMAMGSFQADGGVVSTALDQLSFLRAFMDGSLFPAAYLDEMTGTWNKIFFPLEYGVGLMRYLLPRYLSPFKAAPEMIGHSGASGAILYAIPERDLYVAGTVNQVKKRRLSYQLLSRV